MANRHLARSIVLQTLFEWDTMLVPGRDAGSGAGEKKAAPLADVDGILARNAEEFGGGEADRPFMDTLLKGVVAKQQDLDLIIEKAAPEWPLDRIAPIDRN